jgi:hypothetical protein
MLPTKYDKTTLNSKEIYTALQTSAHNAGIRVFNTYILRWTPSVGQEEG